MNNLSKRKFSVKYISIAFLLPFILQLALFMFQLKQDVVSGWNMISIAEMVFLYFFALASILKGNRDSEEIIAREKEKYEETVKEQNMKLSKKSRKIVGFIGIVFVLISVLFFYLYSSKTKGLELINSRVIDQKGETIVETKVTDEGIVETEKNYIEVLVEYEFNGEVKDAVIKATTTDEIKVDELKIYIDENGKFISDYGRLEIWKFEAIIFLSFACLMIICAIFNIGAEFILGAVFMLIGTALMFVIGCPMFENMLYNDITCFMLTFANVGLCLILCGIFVLIFGRFSVYGLYNTKLENEFKSQIKPEFEEEDDSLICDGCGEKVNENDKFCGNCGFKLWDD